MLEKILDAPAPSIRSIQTVLQIVKDSSDKIQDVHVVKTLSILPVLLIVSDMPVRIHDVSLIVEADLFQNSVDSFVMIILLILFVKEWNYLENH